ncbi:uncharacterized protein LOC127788469 isoform X1 [Diospyros lotus]|uniref:uncharacterized protein LOC127788469 isoform X1 n=1 Tax=Diospyros lotus TaxID=55363 RepID=UPI00225468B1|nr:uncharacterized protein LOC127788469 isoform X1 [Diospyros lotus]XP_052172720.1 uncharacterized protein LOC127788469 isoform X1 [Diospyros lotus]XP_052172721.1 uncharacterized protein LOC127788469 isoform X1 [Diospyros lotus]
MEASAVSSDAYRGSSTSSSSSNSRRYGVQLSASNFFQSPLSSLLEYSGILRTRPSHQESDSVMSRGVSVGSQGQVQNDSVVAGNDGEVSIRIIGSGEHEHDRIGTAGQLRGVAAQNEVYPQPMARTASTLSVLSALGGQGDSDSRSDQWSGESVPQTVNGGVAEGADSGVNSRDSPYQRYDIQRAAKWIEQVLPCSLLLLVVFVRLHLEGFLVTIWIAVVMFKSNEIIQKQTALKGERKISVLIGISFVFVLHVIGVYWWYQNDDLLYPLIMLPPKEIPPFWHAVFIILVNDTLVRQAAMVLKCFLLMYYRNGRGRNYCEQGQMLTLVEYLLLLYRALLPAPVWYRFFLNKEYGSLFSSLMTGLYLTFKLTSVVEKVQSFFAALKALSRKEILYGTHATSEQVSAAGDLCAICQEKMHAPILLRCKHIFCEDCVSEWFEKERTCPLCRALVKPADLKSFGDGSTSLLLQIF